MNVCIKGAVECVVNGILVHLFITVCSDTRKQRLHILVAFLNA